MKLGYQIATPEIKRSDWVTAYQDDIKRSFDFIKNTGYDGVELMVADPKKVDSELINHLQETYQLPVCMVCTGEIFGQERLFFSDLDVLRRQKAIKKVKDAIDLAKSINVRQINIGRVRGGTTIWGDREKQKELSLEGLHEVSRYGEKSGVTIALEPVNSIACSFINSTQDGILIIKEMNELALKLMLDSNHMFIEDKDLLESIERSAPYIVHVHLADSNRLYPGQGKINFVEFIEKLSHIGYDGWLCVEVFQRPDQKTAALKSFQHISSILRNLDFKK